MGCLDKKMDEFIALKTLKDRSGELFAMKYFLGIDETSPTLEQSLKMQLKLSMNYQPLMELSILAEKKMLKHEKHHNILILICKKF